MCFIFMQPICFRVFRLPIGRRYAASVSFLSFLAIACTSLSFLAIPGWFF